MICPQCGALGAIATRSVVPDGETDVYCNACCKESSIAGNLLRKYMEPMIPKKKEWKTIKVSYNGFAGLLLKLEARIGELRLISGAAPYSLDIWDEEKHVTYSFNGVILADVKFLGGAVSFE